ncbi:hypothetical protein DFH29DRAFT_877497 [Suillus ampliporus]|nr:hypothetical protein DFH29DRAFT_877497 [Suillus ampliporus]
MNLLLGVNTAAYSHPQYPPPHNDMYLHAPHHHATNAAHMETYDTCAPAHQQYSEDYGVRAPVRAPAHAPSQQQQYPEVYSCAPARTPSQQQYMETYDTHPPALVEYSSSPPQSEVYMYSASLMNLKCPVERNALEAREASPIKQYAQLEVVDPEALEGRSIKSVSEGNGHYTAVSKAVDSTVRQERKVVNVLHGCE